MNNHQHNGDDLQSHGKNTKVNVRVPQHHYEVTQCHCQVSQVIIRVIESQCKGHREAL